MVDRFDDIDTRHMEGSTPIVNSMPFSLTPMRTDGVLKEVLVVKLTSSVFNPRLRVWAVEVRLMEHLPEGGVVVVVVAAVVSVVSVVGVVFVVIIVVAMIMITVAVVVVVIG